LKKLRALLGITQEQFAKRSEIPLEIITAIENDQEVDPVVFMKLDILGTLLTFEKLKDRIVPFSEMKKIPIRENMRWQWRAGLRRNTRICL